MKKIFIIVSICGFAAIFVLSLILAFLQKSPSQNPTTIAIPTPVVFSSHPQQQNLKIVSINPPDQTQSISLRQTFTITFNQSVTSNDVSVSITPSVAFSLDYQGSKVIITPKDTLSENSEYYIFVHVKDTDHYTFTYLTPINPSINPPDNMQEIEREDARNNHPDQYLNLFMPFTGDTFSIYSDYSYDTPAHYYFLVTLFGPDQNQDKQDFLSWLSSIGLSKNQVNSLDIHYQ